MAINDIIEVLRTKHRDYGTKLYPAASIGQMETFEHTFKLYLPDDIKEFYRFCNGFESNENLFRIIPLDEITSNTDNYEPYCFYIAEYMIYCDMWSVKLEPENKNDYNIFNEGKKYRVLTKLFAGFLERFLAGGVFDRGGLYDWHEEIDKKNSDV